MTNNYHCTRQMSFQSTSCRHQPLER